MSKPVQRGTLETSELRGWLESYVWDQAFLARYPYYAYVLAELEPVADPSVPLMGVSLVPTLTRTTGGSSARAGRYYLHVNIEALQRDPRFLRGLLLHEVHHIVLGHLAHPKFFGVDQRDLMQMAQEMSANEHIEEPLPEPVLVKHFERFGVRPGQSTLERYELLCKARAEGQEPKPQRDTHQVDPHAWQEQASPPPGGIQETRELLQRVRDQGADDAERVKVKQPQHARLAGRSPDQLLAQLGGTQLPPKVAIDWREALRNFVAQARAPMHTWSRPNRRFPGRIGEVPGRAYQRRTVLRPLLIIAIDTSMSMTEDELSEVARQLSRISEHARLHVVECDVKITRSYPFRGRLEHVEGRGGTDLRPVFEPSLLRSLGADGVVYFTDGDGPTPEQAPHGINVLWVLTKGKAPRFHCSFGDIVSMG
ncbi:MAG: VWA-like domain-containing protein [Myxococcales bacterium]